MTCWPDQETLLLYCVCADAPNSEVCTNHPREATQQDSFKVSRRSHRVLRTGLDDPEELLYPGQCYSTARDDVTQVGSPSITASKILGGSLMIFVLPDDSLFCIVCLVLYVHAFILKVSPVAGLSLLSYQPF